MTEKICCCCDYCGKEIKKGFDYIKTRFLNKPYDIDFCKKCYKEIFEWDIKN
jgi:hypothetical protein